jgi:CubicO group peptidase (beta-lactamase class C family)
MPEQVIDRARKRRALVPIPPADTGRKVPSWDEGELHAHVARILNRRPAVGLAVGAVRDGRLAFFHAHGAADIATHAPITEDTVFRIASISKTFTAIAVMQLWERGLLDLDGPANDALRAFRLIPAEPSHRPASIRHLLTHTAGIPEVLRASDLLRPDWGDSVALGSRIPSLAEFYGEGIRLVSEPGQTFAYTNHAFAALQQIVEDVSGEPFDRYLREHVFAPLGMADTDLIRTDRLASRMATWYTFESGGPVPVVEREWVTAGASSIYSTTRDMGRYLAALLGGGANEHGSILKPATVASMFEAHWRQDPRVPGMGLGFDRNPTGGHLVVGHGGILPGLNAQMFLAPDDGVGVIAWTNGARQAMLWLPAEMGRFLNRLLGVPDDAIRDDLPQRPEAWAHLCGWYRPRGAITDVRARLMLGAGAQVFVRGDRLLLRVLSPIPALLRGFELHPDDEVDPTVFRIDLAEFGLSTARIVFGREAADGSRAVSMDLFPMSLHRGAVRSPADRRRRVILPLMLVGAAGWTAVIARGMATRRDGPRRPPETWMRRALR